MLQDWNTGNAKESGWSMSLITLSACRRVIAKEVESKARMISEHVPWKLQEASQQEAAGTLPADYSAYNTTQTQCSICQVLGAGWLWLTGRWH